MSNKIVENPQEMFTYMISYKFTVNGINAIGRRFIDTPKEIKEENDLYDIEDELKRENEDFTELIVISFTRMERNRLAIKPSHMYSNISNDGGSFWKPEEDIVANDVDSICKRAIFRRSIRPDEILAADYMNLKRNWSDEE